MTKVSVISRQRGTLVSEQLTEALGIKQGASSVGHVLSRSGSVVGIEPLGSPAVGTNSTASKFDQLSSLITLVGVQTVQGCRGVFASLQHARLVVLQSPEGVGVTSDNECVIPLVLVGTVHDSRSLGLVSVPRIIID